MSLRLLRLLVYYGDGIITLLNLKTNEQKRISLEEAYNVIKDFSEYNILTPLRI